MSFAQNAALLAFGAAGAAVIVNKLSKSNSTSADAMRRRSEIYNSQVHPEQEKSHTLPNDVRARKPWNRTYAEDERVRHEYEDLDELVSWVFG